MVFFFLIMPLLAGEMRRQYPEAAFLYWPGMVYGWVIGALCYAVLFRFYQVCRRIGKDTSFSMENAKAFVSISRILLLMGGIWFAGILFLAFMRCLKGKRGLDFQHLAPASLIYALVYTICGGNTVGVKDHLTIYSQ